MNRILTLKRLYATTLAMKKSHFILLSLICMALALSGCVFVEKDEIYNNSERDLTVIAKYSTNSVPHLVKKGETLEFYSPFIEIRHSNDTWHYERKPFALEFHKRAGEKPLIKFYKRTGGNQILVKLQIQPDGAIYLIPPDSNGPVTNFPEQPEGFPLRPQNKQ
jgi:hypothetical protein